MGVKWLWFLRAIRSRRVAGDGSEGEKAEEERLGDEKEKRGLVRRVSGSGFHMPLHYPRYTKEEYERMEEWKVDMVLKEYGLALDGSLEEKRAYAIGTFLWPDQ